MEGQVAVITGAGRGIGRASALLFAQSGAQVVICSRTEAELSATDREVKKYGGGISSHLVDVSDQNAVKEMMAKTVKHYGRIDVLVNNASILGPMSLLSELPVADWDEVIRINLNSLFYVRRSALPVMLGQNHQYHLQRWKEGPCPMGRLLRVKIRRGRADASFGGGTQRNRHPGHGLKPWRHPHPDARCRLSG